MSFPSYNRLNLDYHQSPTLPIAGPLIDCHCHVRNLEWTKIFVSAAQTYGITRFWTMCPLEEVAMIQEHFPNTFDFIAVPNWQAGAATEAFITDWQKRLDAFRQLGAKFMKLHFAPGTQKRWGMSYDHPLIQRIIRHGHELGYHFMTHVGDPKVWFEPGKRYADAAEYGTFDSQFPPLERMLEAYPDRLHWGAHFGGSLENLPALTARMLRFPHYFVDTSATKWITRAIAEHETAGELEAVRQFILNFQDRILFGSDLVLGNYEWDHYASRYWVHQQQWASAYRGANPIEDPDAQNGQPQLIGLDLPPEVLTKMYRTNAPRLLTGK